MSRECERIDGVLDVVANVTKVILVGLKEGVSEREI